jgi:hypothetical protein
MVGGSFQKMTVKDTGSGLDNAPDSMIFIICVTKNYGRPVEIV